MKGGDLELNKDLSIIIPVYNVEPYLRKCLDSVLKKIPNNTEIIIINDRFSRQF